MRSIIAGMRRCSTGELVCVCAHACAGKYSVFKCIAYTCEHAYDVPHAHECANNSHCSTTCLHTHTHVRACVRFTCQPVGSPDPCAASCRLLALAGLLGRIARTRLPSAAPSPQAQNAVQRSGRQADRRAASPHGAIPPGIMTPAGPAGRRRHAMHHQYEGGEIWRRHAECGVGVVYAPLRLLSSASMAAHPRLALGRAMRASAFRGLASMVIARAPLRRRAVLGTLPDAATLRCDCVSTWGAWIRQFWSVPRHHPTAINGPERAGG